MDKNYKKEASKDEAAIPQSRKVSFIVLVGLFTTKVRLSALSLHNVT